MSGLRRKLRVLRHYVLLVQLRVTVVCMVMLAPISLINRMLTNGGDTRLEDFQYLVAIFCAISFFSFGCLWATKKWWSRYYGITEGFVNGCYTNTWLLMPAISIAALSTTIMGINLLQGRGFDWTVRPEEVIGPMLTGVLLSAATVKGYMEVLNKANCGFAQDFLN